MRMRVLIRIGLVALALTFANPAAAQECVGDCDGDTNVQVSELVTSVRIALGVVAGTACPAIGDATIDRLVAAVVSSMTMCGKMPLPTPTDTPAVPTDTPTATPTPTAQEACGDGMLQEGEDCDDGNNFGGDGCAANCTSEILRTSLLDGPNSISSVQATNFRLLLQLEGSQGFTTGRPRDDVVRDPQGNVVTMPGDIPVAIRAEHIIFEPVGVTGLVCACVRQFPVPELFGEGISGVGVIACGDAGLEDVDYKLRQDHNTNPDMKAATFRGIGNGSAIPGTLQLPDDPECDDEFVFPRSGVVSKACRERTGDPLCDDPTAFFHRGACNSPRVIEFSGGPVPRGSALVSNNTAIGLLQDGGFCFPMGELVDGQCMRPDDPTKPLRDYGPDCIPCTEDDLDFGTEENLPTTTGTAVGAVYDAANQAGVAIDVGSREPCSVPEDCEIYEACSRSCDVSGFLCGSDEECGEGETCRPFQCQVSCPAQRCFTGSTGSLFDCDRLLSPDVENDPTGGLGGGRLAVTFPDIDARQIGDNVTSSVLAFPE
jgi:cysteine-rich repeat protein